MIDLFFSIAPFLDKAIMVILAIFSIVVLGISLERYFYLRPLYRKTIQIRRILQNIFQYGDLSKITELSGDKTHPGGRMVLYATTHIKKHNSEGLEELCKATYLHEKPALEGGISILATIGANAPFIGLLGTVFGIMKAFNDLGGFAESGQQELVMSGISTALLATAMGLMVAIPSVILYNYFRKRVNIIMNNLENIKETCLAYSRSQKRN